MPRTGGGATEMMKASWKDDVVTWKTGRGNVLVPIKRGQFVFGRHAAAKALGITTLRDVPEVLVRADKVIRSNGFGFPILDRLEV